MRLHKSTNGQLGLTLVELIIAFALLGVLIVFVLGITTMVIGLTAKMQTTNIALSLAQEKIEELRGTKNIPPYVVDTPRPGYTRTVSSSFLKEMRPGTTTTATVPFLRKVWVTVEGPVGLGTRTVTLETFIQTERPQVAFLFSSNGTDYARASPRETVLVGSIVDDGHDIPKSQVFYWTSATGTPTTSLANDIYLDKGWTKPAPATLSPGNVYYFKIVKSALLGIPLDIKVQATNAIGYYNFQPTGPYPVSSWLRLLADEDKPSTPTAIITNSSAPYVKIGVSDLEISEHLAISATSTDDTSGVGGIFLSIMRTTTTEAVTFWDDGLQNWSTAIPTPIYVEMTLTNPETGAWSYTPTISAQNSCNPGDQLKVIAYAIDKVIGEKYTYTNSIPTNGPFGADNHAWPNVNANPSMPSNTITLTCASTPTVYTLPATGLPSSPITLQGSVNPNGAPTSAWFEWGQPPSYGNSTDMQPMGTDVSFVDFSALIGTLNPGEYRYRAAAKNVMGTAYGVDQFFVIPPPTSSPTPYITVLTPNGGENWTTTSTQTISWTSDGIAGNVTIELSRDNGTTWEPLFVDTSNDGVEPWTVTGSTSSSMCIIRISAFSNPSIFDKSDNVFSISP